MEVDNGEADNRRLKKSLLKDYYTETSDDPLDINGSAFQPNIYLDKLRKERSLNELMDKTTEMVKDIRSLDSDMQTLVYENYNKFISATETIRKMKNDFKKMEDEMDHLATNMSAITEFSSCISDTLYERRQHISKLSQEHAMLKKLQFLFELPSRLKKCIELEAYSQAVRNYTKSRKVLHQYQHMASFQGIQKDCNEIVTDLCVKLRKKFHDEESTPKQLAECVDLLLQLNEPAEELCEEFLSHTRQKIDEDLAELEKQLRLQAGEEVCDENSRPADAYIDNSMDILEFMDSSCNGFLSNVCLVVASYNDMFLNRQQENEQLDAIALKKLVNFVNELMEKYFNYVEKRVEMEKETGDNTILVRALDRFHRRLQAMNKLLPDTDFSRVGLDIVSRAAKDRVLHYLQSLKQHFADCMTDIRQNLAAPRHLGKSDNNQQILPDLLQSMQTSIIDQVKSVLSNLEAFINTDITFAMKPHFRGPFCVKDVREGLIVTFLHHITDVCNNFCLGTSEKGSAPPTLILILSKLCEEFHTTTIADLVNFTDEKFMLDSSDGLTDISTLCDGFKSSAQGLLDFYVKVQGQNISQMLRKSVETRNWLDTIEPRTVRAVMKRVVEDITAIDMQVGQLYEEGSRKEQGSDSTRRSTTYTNASQKKSNWSYTPNQIDNSLISHINKLFSERIDIFTQVEFSKVSVLTGIVKISLKTFLECVRLRTFGKFGLQQIQVDTHYLMLYLWPFVSDENLVRTLLDEIVVSTGHRCLDPILMELSVVERICEMG